MLAPARPSLVPGAARLGVELVDGLSAVTTCAARAPARLLTPIHRGPAAWCYTTSFGGGLVAGDHLDLTLTLGAGACALLASQASTKVYRSDSGAVSRQDLDAAVGPGGLLVNLPAPVTAFRGARFAARNRYRLDPTASLVALDWFSAGRSAYAGDGAGGEDWAFSGFATTTTVRVGDQERLRDAVELAPGAGLPTVATRMAGLRVLATVVVLGPRVEALAAGLSQRVVGPPGPRDPVLEALSPLAGGCLWRLAAAAVEPVQRRVATALAPLAEQLGGDPWRRTF